jgi:hypothetical protein
MRFVHGYHNCGYIQQQYSRGNKKRAIAEKICETLAIFSCSLQCCFSIFFSIFTGPLKSIFECGRIYFYTQDTVATIEGHKVTPFFRSGFYKMLGQNKTKGNKKFLIAKKVRIRACPELEVTRTAMADCLGRLGCKGHLGR